MDKHAVVAELGIRYRDLRILDPLVSTAHKTMSAVLYTRTDSVMFALCCLTIIRHSGMLQVPTPYPTALFIRDKALVVNLESIRMIISADQVSKVRTCLCC